MEQRGDVTVVGAGLAGAACARELADAGVDVRVLDRGRRPGGRLSGRRLGGRHTDLGASYLTVGGDDFGAVVEEWRRRGLVRPWTDSFTVVTPGASPQQKAGPLRWGGPEGLGALAVDLLGADLPVESREVAVVAADGGLAVDGEPTSAVVLAMPDPQAVRLLGPGAEAVRSALRREWEPVLALAARWERRTWDAPSPDGVFHGAFVNDDPVLAFVADDGRRRGDDAPHVVAHSTPELAREHLDDPQAAEPVLRMALTALLDAAEPSETLLHRWSFARPVGERAAPYLLQEAGGSLVGVCGDGWGETSKVETAWRSGRDLGRTLAGRLGVDPR